MMRGPDMENIISSLLFAASMAFLLLSFPGTAPLSARKEPGRFIGVTALLLPMILLAFYLIHMQGNTPRYTFYPYMLLIFLAAAGTIRAIADASWPVALTRALTWYLLTDSVSLLFEHASIRMLDRNLFQTFPWWSLLLSNALLTAVEYMLLRGIRRLLPGEPQSSTMTAALSLLSAIPYLYVRQITLWLPVQVEEVTGATVFALFCCMLLTVTMTIGMEYLLNAELEKRSAMKWQLDYAYLQQNYELQSSNMELVRRQYHDMKNLLLYLDQGSAQGDAKEKIGAVLESIAPFEALLNTGNNAADIVLNAKLSLCRRSGISCSIMLDGGRLSFMDPLDIVTILGNALDNAIEACQSLPETRLKSIRVRTGGTGELLVLKIENSCPETLQVNGGPLQTTKADHTLHGYGLRSILSAVEKYQGHMQYSSENGVFQLTLVIPAGEKALTPV